MIMYIYIYMHVDIYIYIFKYTDVFMCVYTDVCVVKKVGGVLDHPVLALRTLREVRLYYSIIYFT